MTPAAAYERDMTSKIYKPVLILSLLTALSGCATVERLAIPKSDLISSDIQKSGTQNQISNRAWDGFLQQYAQLGPDGVVRVNYGAVTDQDKQGLDAYVQTLSDLDISQYERNAQLAYWINLYNSLTISVILDHYPVDSIRDIRKNIFDLGPWNDKRITAGGRELSLYDIENGIVRPAWPDDPRTHYALNCAAIGCPNLAQTAYTADNITERLQENAVEYVNDPRGVTIEDNGDLTVSKIYNWYRGDFGTTDTAVISHLKQYASPKLKSKLEQLDKIDGYVYDWSLNDPTTVSMPQ